MEKSKNRAGKLTKASSVLFALGAVAGCNVQSTAELQESDSSQIVPRWIMEQVLSNPESIAYCYDNNVPESIKESLRYYDKKVTDFERSNSLERSQEYNGELYATSLQKLKELSDRLTTAGGGNVQIAQPVGGRDLLYHGVVVDRVEFYSYNNGNSGDYGNFCMDSSAIFKLTKDKVIGEFRIGETIKVEIVASDGIIKGNLDASDITTVLAVVERYTQMVPVGSNFELLKDGTFQNSQPA